MGVKLKCEVCGQWLEPGYGKLPNPRHSEPGECIAACVRRIRVLERKLFMK